MHMSHNNSAFNIFTSFFIIFFLLLQPSSFSSALVLFSSYCYYYYYYHHTTTTVTAATTTTTKEKMSRSGDHQKYATLEVEGESSGVPRENTKGKTPIMEAPLIGKSGTYSNEKEGSETNAAAGVKRGVSVIDFVVRLLALVAALAATIIMGTTDQTLPFFTQFFQFRARYYDLPSFTYFVIANAITAAYLVLSLPFSIVTIVRPLANAPRLVLIIFDTIAWTLITSAAASAAAIVYLAHKGNTNTNWIAICQQFDSFCSRSSGAVVASFIAAVLFILLVILSTVALKSH